MVFDIIQSAGVIFSIFYTLKNNKKIEERYIKSLEPRLSFYMYQINDNIFLTMKNSGQVNAENIYVDKIAQKHNGDESLNLGALFLQDNFCLGAEESVTQWMGKANYKKGMLYPEIQLRVKYYSPLKERKVSNQITIERWVCLDNVKLLSSE